MYGYSLSVGYVLLHLLLFLALCVTAARQEFYCDETGETLTVGSWWHRQGSAYDLCHAEYVRRVAAEPSLKSQFTPVHTVADLAADAWRYDEQSARGGGRRGCGWRVER